MGRENPFLVLGEERDFVSHILLLLCAQCGRVKKEIPRTSLKIAHLIISTLASWWQWRKFSAKA